MVSICVWAYLHHSAHSHGCRLNDKNFQNTPRHHFHPIVRHNDSHSLELLLVARSYSLVTRSKRTEHWNAVHLSFDDIDKQLGTRSEIKVTNPVLTVVINSRGHCRFITKIFVKILVSETGGFPAELDCTESTSCGWNYDLKLHKMYRTLSRHLFCHFFKIFAFLDNASIEKILV